MTRPHVAFIVKNKFQIAQFDNLANSYPAATYLLMDRRSLWCEFVRQDVAQSRIPIHVVSRTSVPRISSKFDVIFFQTTFAGIEKVSTPLVSVQYGLAKERHNYGEWRALADLNLMYGEYSVRQVQHFSPSAAVGNIKFAGWKRGEDKRTAKNLLDLDQGLPTALYMPTYGELGTFEEMVRPLGQLSQKFNILIKMHHNNEKQGPEWIKIAHAHGIAHCFGGGDDQKLLLSATDVVISDYSGAIFDAIYAEVPVVLYQPNSASRQGIQRFDLTSLEFRRRAELGVILESIGELEKVLYDAIEDSADVVDKAKSIRAEIFAEENNGDPVSKSKSMVNNLLSGIVPPLSIQQMYVRESVKSLMVAEHKLRTLEEASQKRNLIW